MKTVRQHSCDDCSHNAEAMNPNAVLCMCTTVCMEPGGVLGQWSPAGVAHIENERQTKDRCRHCRESIVELEDGFWIHHHSQRALCNAYTLDDSTVAESSKLVAAVRNER